MCFCDIIPYVLFFASILAIIIVNIPMGHEKKLNCILKFLYISSKDIYKNINQKGQSFNDLRYVTDVHGYVQNNGFKNIEASEITLMLEYLYSNGRYIDRDFRMKDWIKEEEYSYRITYKGKFFYDKGGFVSKKITDTLKNLVYGANIIFVCLASIFGGVYSCQQICNTTKKQDLQNQKELINTTILKVDSLIKSYDK